EAHQSPGPRLQSPQAPSPKPRAPSLSARLRDPGAARPRALNFGATRASKARMDAILQDLRYAVRTLIKNPGFAALTITCLALGIGVNSTIFSVVDTVAIRPLPFREPDRLVALATTHQANGIDRGNVSYLDLQDWRAR